MHPWLTPGKAYFVRTVSDHWVGRLVSVDGPHELTLEDFAWVAHSGRLSDFLRSGKAEGMEVEAAPAGTRLGVHYLAVIEWPHELLRKTV